MRIFCNFLSSLLLPLPLSTWRKKCSRNLSSALRRISHSLGLKWKVKRWQAKWYRRRTNNRIRLSIDNEVLFICKCCSKMYARRDETNRNRIYIREYTWQHLPWDNFSLNCYWTIETWGEQRVKRNVESWMGIITHIACQHSLYGKCSNTDIFTCLSSAFVQ